VIALRDRRVIVTGGSRGLGRGIVEALVAEEARVVAVARDAAPLGALAGETGAEIAPLDVTDDDGAGRLLREVRPDLLVLCAGAMPPLDPLQDQTWEAFSRNWEVDAKSTFFWLRHVLRMPLAAGAHVVVVSSGAALRGSPVSGGYASAKRAQWFMTDYASQESQRLELGLRFHCLLPALNPSTALGRAGIDAYAARAGVTAEAFARRFSPVLTPAIMGKAIVDLATDPERFNQLAYTIGGAGLAPIA
jgi:NAD(P)-dependent dehydrogenase (short-subunit alcohol dehydrogenase family)